MLCDMSNAPGKSPSVWRVAAIAGAVAMAASAMAPAHAASLPSKPLVAKKKVPDVARPQQQPAGRGGGSASPLSLQWMMGTGLRP